MTTKAIRVKLRKSTKSDKKYMARVDHGNRHTTVHFGAAGMSDYTKHKDPERKKRYIVRHRKRENWNKSGIDTAGFWSRWLLWNKPTIRESKENIAKKFDVIFV